MAEILKGKKTIQTYEHGFSDEEVRNWLDNQLYRYENDGFGLMGVILKEEGKFIGQCGLTMQDYKGEKVPKIGYLFNKLYWNKGYASESAKKSKSMLFMI